MNPAFVGNPNFDNPFAEVQGAIEKLLAGNQDVVDIVPPGNQVTDGWPKTISAPQDFGQWVVQPYQGGGAKTSSSTSFRVVQNYEIGYVSDNVDIKAQLFSLKWRIIKLLGAALNDDPTLGLKYVTDVIFLDIREQKGPLDSDSDTGVFGWTGIIVLSVSMNFNKADLTA